MTTKKAVPLGALVLGALVAEFLVLEETIGISAPRDRQSAVSRVEVKVRNRELHAVTKNSRFTVVDRLLPGGKSRELLVLRETLLADWAVSLEGPSDASVMVEALDGHKTRWTFRDMGERGEVVSQDLYEVSMRGCCGGPSTFTYFSLANGRKLRTANHKLSGSDLELLGRAKSTSPSL